MIIECCNVALRNQVFGKLKIESRKSKVEGQIQ